MPPISTGVAGGSSLAIALKTLNWLDRNSDPYSYCSALGAQIHTRFDWFAFAVGIVLGAALLAFLELVISLRFALNSWANSCSFPDRSDRPRGYKPLYKLL